MLNQFLVFNKKHIITLLSCSLLCVSIVFSQQGANTATPAVAAPAVNSNANPAAPKALDNKPAVNSGTLGTPAAEENLPLTSIQFEKTEHEFGKIKQDAPVTHRYNFKNTGKNPLVIQSAKGSCGCTTPNWSKDPIPPGGSGFVEAQFNPKGRPGMNHKTVTVTCNTETKTHTLTFKAEVEEEKPAVNPAQPAGGSGTNTH